MQMQGLEKLIVNSRLWNFILRRAYFPELLQPVETDGVEQVLEIGSGVGVTTEEILKSLPSATLTAIDYDSSQVERAKARLVKKYGDRVLCLKGDATALGFPNEAFDAVFEFNVFHHIQNYPKAMSEVFRVLKPGGRFYLMDVDRHFFNRLIKIFFPPEALFSREEFLQGLKAMGFQVEKAQGTRRVFYLVARKPQR